MARAGSPRSWDEFPIPRDELVKTEYDDRVVLVCKESKDWRVRFELMPMLRTVKLDLADLHQHVTIEKETGTWRQFRLTPEDNGEFIRQVTAARAKLMR